MIPNIFRTFPKITEKYPKMFRLNIDKNWLIEHWNTANSASWLVKNDITHVWISLLSTSVIPFLSICYHSLYHIFFFISGQNPPDPVGRVTCNDDHTVDISITNVDDLGEWEISEWQLEDSAACEPTFSGTTVTYTGLVLPNCSMSSEQLPDSIKYVLKVSATKPDPGSGTTGQLRAYDHLYYVSCDYDNQNRSSASFVPIVNRNDNDTGMWNKQLWFAKPYVSYIIFSNGPCLIVVHSRTSRNWYDNYALVRRS